MWVSRSFMVCGTGKIRICYGIRPKILGTSLTLCGFVQELPIRFQRSCFFDPGPQQGVQLPADSKGYIMTGS